MSDSDGSDREITGREYEELCRNCDRLCHKLYDPPLPVVQTKFKKDSRVWLHKNPGFRLAKGVGEDNDDDKCPYDIVDMFGRRFKKDSRTWLHKSSTKRQLDTNQRVYKEPCEIYGPISPPPPQFIIEDHDARRTTRVHDGDSSDSDNPYTIVDSMGRRFKKDSRTWLHKSSSKRKKAKPELEEDDVPELPDTPTNPPGQISINELGEQNCERKFCEIIKTGNDISKRHQSSVMMRKRKRRCQQMSLSANASPNDYRYNAEICRILSAELDDSAQITSDRKTASYNNIFELFDEDDDDYVGCGLPQDNTTRSNNAWRETRVITSDTSTQSSNDNQEINQSPLSSGASINLSSDTRSKSSPVFTSTAVNNFHNKLPQKANCFHSNGQNSDTEVNDCSLLSNDNQTTNCPNQGKSKMADKLNVNSASSRSVCFLIAETDEFLTDPILSEYEEESD